MDTFNCIIEYHIVMLNNYEHIILFTLHVAVQVWNEIAEIR